MLARLRVLSGSSGYIGWGGSLDDTQPRVLLRARPSFVAGDFYKHTHTNMLANSHARIFNSMLKTATSAAMLYHAAHVYVPIHIFTLRLSSLFLFVITFLHLFYLLFLFLADPQHCQQALHVPKRNNIFEWQLIWQGLISIQSVLTIFSLLELFEDMWVITC